jgi:hypothetical protein
MIINYKYTFGLREGKGASVTQKQMPSQREQYGNTVHLFIGKGRNPCKITFRPCSIPKIQILKFSQTPSKFKMNFKFRFKMFVCKLISTNKL